MYIFHHRWSVYYIDPHAPYSHACVDACTIYVVHPNGINLLEINFEFWRVLVSLHGPPDGGKQPFRVTIIKSLRTFALIHVLYAKLSTIMVCSPLVLDCTQTH